MFKIYKLADLYENICFNLFKIAGLKEVKEKYPNISKEIDELNNQVKPKYLGWGAKQLNDGFVLQDIAEALKTFDRLSQNLETIDRDINKYDSLETLKTKLETLQSRQRRTVDTKGLDAEVLYEDARYTMVRPNTKMASIKLGSGTKWCITEQKREHFNRYQSDNVVFYILIDKTLKSSNTNYKIAFSVERDLECNIIKITGWDATNKDRKPEEYPGYSLVEDIIKKDAEALPPNMIVYFNEEMLSEEEANYFISLQDAEFLEKFEIPRKYRHLVNPVENIETETKEQKYQYLRNPNISITKKIIMIKEEKDPNTLLYLSTKNDLPNEIIEPIIKNNNTPINVLGLLYKKYKDKDKDAFIQNPNCPSNILFDILVETHKSNERPDHLVTSLFLRRDITPQMIDFMLKHCKFSDYFNCYLNIINNSYVSIKEKIKVLNSNNIDMLRIVNYLYYNDMPSDVLYIILNIIKERAIPMELHKLESMMWCCNLDLKCFKILLELNPDITTYVFKLPTIPYEILNFLAESEDGDMDILFEILASEKLDDNLYLKIKDKISEYSKIRMAKSKRNILPLIIKHEGNATIVDAVEILLDNAQDSKLFEILSNHNSAKVRLALIKNYNIPSLILEKLTKDKDQYVREAAVETYKFSPRKDTDDYSSGNQHVNTEQKPEEESSHDKLLKRKPIFETRKYSDEYISLHGTEDQMMELLDKNPPQKILENMAYNTKIPYNVQFELALLNNDKVNKILYDNPTVDEDIKRDLHAYFHAEYEEELDE
ncbi:MAG: hypothetical protein ACOYMA_00540 [Bacteroidia bacterium]